MDPLKDFGARMPSPQTEQALPNQVENHAGGFVFQVTDAMRAQRFLILGTEGGTYYASERDHTKENAKFIIGMANNPKRARVLLDLVVDISVKGRAHRQQPTLFALAALSASDSAEIRKATFEVLPQVIRTASMLFQFVGYMEQFRGWGRGAVRAIGNWYTDKDINDVAYQLIKYRQRNGWTHRDLLRLSHPVPKDNRPGAWSSLFEWLTKGDTLSTGLPPFVQGYVEAQAATTGKQWAKIIEEYRLPWEALPTQALKEVEVWNALLPNTPPGALVRNLGRLTSIGLIAPMSDALRTVKEKLTDADGLKKARLHPMAVLIALSQYHTGHGDKGSLEWTPNQQVLSALEDAFYGTFANVEPANARTMIALDCSGSMDGTSYRGYFSNIANTNLSPREAAAAMCLVTVRTEPQYMILPFSDRITSLPINDKTSLSEAISLTRQVSPGGTDCALPMLFAAKEQIPIDHFVIFTDNETYAGRIHPYQALQNYRQQSGINARLSVVGMTATEFSIAKSDDPGMLDVVGFDSAAPALMSSFARGEL